MFEGKAEELFSRLDPSNSLETSLRLGWEQLTAMDYAAVAERAGGVYDPDARSIRLFLFHDEIVVSPAEREITRGGNGRLDPFSTALVLHHLVNAKNIPLAGRYISFREVPGGGSVYYPAFRRHSIEPIAKRFGNDPEALLRAGARVGARVLDRGDASVEVAFLPRVPVTVIVWAGDEEVPASATVIFDATAPEQLPVEDIARVGHIVARRLIDVSIDVS